MKKSFAVLIFLIITSTAWGQKYDKAYLQKQNSQIQKEIAKLNEVLSKARKESKNSLLYVVTLDNKIQKRAKYISNAKKEKRFIEDDIYNKQLEINKYQRELADLKKDYGEVLVKAYKNKTVQNKMLFVLSSNDLTQAFRRIKYLQLYSDYQDNKADEIKQKIADIEKLKASREKDIQDQKTLLARQEAEVQKLEDEKLEKNKAVAEFKKNEGKIIADLKVKQSEQQKLESQIQLAIAEEIRIREKAEAERRAKLEAERKEKERLAKEAAEKERARLKAIADDESRKRKERKEAEKALAAAPTVENKPASGTPKEIIVPKSDYALLSEGFVNNRGKLPSPISGGVVVSGFGRHEHPLISGLMVDNKGVDISGSPNSSAKAIYKGVVSRIQKQDGNLLAIMVQHGEYYSVYTNIDDAYVKTGDQVSVGQDLGHIFTNENNRAESKLMIYKGLTIQNPQQWVRLY